MKKLLLFAALLSSTLAMALPENGVIYVKPEATGTGDGSSWNNAIGSLYDALVQADTFKIEGVRAPKDVWVAAGRYETKKVFVGWINDGAGGTVYMAFKPTNQVNMYGGFAGTESTLEERALAYEGAKPWEFQHATILDGGGNSRVVGVNGVCTDPTYFDGFTVRGGNGYDSADINGNGGGINMRGTMIVQNCIVEENTGYKGGGVSMIPAGGTLRNTIIQNNRAVFIDNDPSKAGISGWAGGILTQYCWHGSASNEAGYHDTADAVNTIENCEIIGNSANRASAMQFDPAKRGTQHTVLRNCIVVNNTPSDPSFWARSLMNISGATDQLYNNLIAYNKGAIRSAGVDGLAGASLLNNTIVYNDDFTVSYKTMTETTQFNNNIVWANQGTASGSVGAFSLPQVRNGEVKNNMAYCSNLPFDTLLVDDNVEIRDNIRLYIDTNIDVTKTGFVLPLELAGPLQDLEYFYACDFSLSESSPLIDRGTAVAMTTDLYGNARQQGAAVDLGAIEAYSTSSLLSAESATWNLHAQNSTLYIAGLAAGEQVSIYTLSGVCVKNLQATQTDVAIKLPVGVYIVVVDGDAQKCIVKY